MVWEMLLRLQGWVDLKGAALQFQALHIFKRNWNILVDFQSGSPGLTDSAPAYLFILGLDFFSPAHNLGMVTDAQDQAPAWFSVILIQCLEYFGRFFTV